MVALLLAPCTALRQERTSTKNTQPARHVSHGCALRGDNSGESSVGGFQADHANRRGNDDCPEHGMRHIGASEERESHRMVASRRSSSAQRLFEGCAHRSPVRARDVAARPCCPPGRFEGGGRERGGAARRPLAFRPRGLGSVADLMAAGVAISATGQKCGSCGLSGTSLKRCTVCKAAYYCSVECQRRRASRHAPRPPGEVPGVSRGPHIGRGRLVSSPMGGRGRTPPPTYHQARCRQPL